MFTSFLRTVILYFVLIVFLRIMGKRQIGELQLTELVVTLLIADLASIPMQAMDIPLLTGLIPMATLLVLEIGVSYLTLKSPWFHRLVSGSSMVLIDHGKIDRQTLAKLRFTLEDLIEELRLNNIEKIEDVEFAVLETNGQLSVFPKRDKRTVTLEDLKGESEKSALPWPVILDGHADKRAMERVGINQAWVIKYLKKQGLSSVGEVFLLNVDCNHQCYLVKKEE
ncbi:MAG: DUF421 domain-containing protein [Clostridia bacterium]|nr:DUF421 domain-containing protein [Clostridia bacterium]